MTTQELADDFVALLKQGRDHDAAKKYNAADIVSYEPMDGPMAEMRGNEALSKKAEWWVTSHEVHGAEIEGPYVHGDTFAVRFAYDFTRKETGERLKMDEVGLYEVKDGKVVSERFFYRKV
jgi:ketosteroid isomerase-like protein